MEKIATLRSALVAAIPAFVTDPDKLKVYVDAGRVQSTAAPALSLRYTYTARIFAEAFAGGPDELMLPLMLWLRRDQPDLFFRYQDDPGLIQFAADILDADSWDIAITLELSEAVRVVARPDGTGWDITHLPEPSPDDPLLDGAIPDVPLRSMTFGGLPILP